MTNIKQQRICLLVHSLDPSRGGGRFALGLSEHLRSEGYQVRVLTTLSAGASPEDALLGPGLVGVISNFYKIREAIRDCDIVHALDPLPYGLLAIVAGVGLKKKRVITAVGSGAVRPLYRLGVASVVRWVYRSMHVRTAISHYVVREIQKKAEALNFLVIVPGIDTSVFDRGATPAYPHPRPYILSVAKVKPRKGVHVALEAFAEVAKVVDAVDYINVGVCEGAYAERIKGSVQELGIESRVLFKERVSDDELKALYRGARAFILLPQDDDHDIEGFGLVYVEAAAFGLPVIGTHNSGAEDALMDGVNGYLIESHDASTAAVRLRSILEDEALRRRLSEASVAFAETLDWKNIVKQYSALYQAL
jgi:glycosyltransferase involved in cell wall biosynthesis